AESREQLVVASAAADRFSRAIGEQNETRPGVITEAAHLAEIETNSFAELELRESSVELGERVEIATGFAPAEYGSRTFEARGSAPELGHVDQRRSHAPSQARTPSDRFERRAVFPGKRVGRLTTKCVWQRREHRSP